jgi:hypothetical protein
MIARIWRGVVRLDDADAYANIRTETYSIPIPRGVDLARLALSRYRLA